MAVPEWQSKAVAQGFGQPIYDVQDEKAWNRVFGGPIPVTVGYVLRRRSRSRPTRAGYVNACYRAQQWIKNAKDEEVVDLLQKPYMSTYSRERSWSRALLPHIFDWDFVIDEKDYDRGMKVWCRWPWRSHSLQAGRGHVVRQEGAGQVQVVSRVRIAIRDLSKTFSQALERSRRVRRVFRCARPGVRRHRRPLGLRQVHILNMIGSSTRHGGRSSLMGPRRRPPAPQIGYVFQKTPSSRGARSSGTSPGARVRGVARARSAPA